MTFTKLINIFFINGSNLSINLALTKEIEERKKEYEMLRFSPPSCTVLP